MQAMELLDGRAIAVFVFALFWAAAIKNRYVRLLVPPLIGIIMTASMAGAFGHAADNDALAFTIMWSPVLLIAYLPATIVGIFVVEVLQGILNRAARNKGE
ncbi:hypothetical protein JY96_21785 [Aquabacterium sp. NJ1]|uniref:hypothetical protein n=1 Tax=Aquabacterium sp. NJ1 TaxID=1538295 RepID=UPI00052D6081|nr:hypothetical protein [Aquabacterium sp. NJ1]KGM38502.1 hypothetical protein JY96_21785 [Aquabacterium sp. NJ1]